MRKLLGIGITALTLASLGASFTASAQSAMETTTSQTTTIPAPVTAPPPVGTLSTTRETHAQDAYGNETTSKSTVYRDTQGVAEDRQTTTRTIVPPPPPPAETTTTTTTESTTGPQ
jgi:hypothetical protein